MPVGYSVSLTPSNTRPATYYYLGSNAGTGDWATYNMIFATTNYVHGASIDFGYVVINGTDNTNVSWWFNDYKIYQLSSSSSYEYDFSSENETVTAQWIQKVSVVNFNAEGGTVTKSEWGDYYSAGGVNATTRMHIKVGNTTLGCPNASTSTITKDGYTFAGWWTGSGGTGEMLIDANGTLQVVSGFTETYGSGAKWTKLAADTPINLYAKWVA